MVIIHNHVSSFSKMFNKSIVLFVCIVWTKFGLVLPRHFSSSEGLAPLCARKYGVQYSVLADCVDY